MAKAQVGKVVKANFGSGEEDAVLLAHGADKDYLIPVSKLEALAYREPEDQDDKGSGRTWWNA